MKLYKITNPLMRGVLNGSPRNPKGLDRRNKMIKIEKITHDLDEFWFELIDLSDDIIDVFMVEQGNPQLKRTYIYDYNHYKRALNDYKNPEIYVSYLLARF
tara:strand:+ start:1066 stop:1368 length:303 start_codon:yes stop_codon:yes gene_type:complete